MIGVRGALNYEQTNNVRTANFGSGWQPGDSHYLFLGVKPGTDNVPATPAGYVDIDTITASGGGLVRRTCMRVLQSGDAAPSLTPVASSSLMHVALTLAGTLNDTEANVLAASTPDHTVNSSSTTINYAQTGLPNEGNCAVLLFGTYNSSDIGTLGTPTTLSGSAVNLLDFVGFNMHAALWMDLQTTAVNVPVGNIPITGGTLQTNRSLIFTVRAAPTVVASGGRSMMIMGVG